MTDNTQAAHMANSGESPSCAPGDAQAELKAVNLQEICKHRINVALAVCHRCDGTAIYTESDLNKRIEEVLDRLEKEINTGRTFTNDYVISEAIGAERAILRSNNGK